MLSKQVETSQCHKVSRVFSLQSQPLCLISYVQLCSEIWKASDLLSSQFLCYLLRSLKPCSSQAMTNMTEQRVFTVETHIRKKTYNKCREGPNISILVSSCCHTNYQVIILFVKRDFCDTERAVFYQGFSTHQLCTRTMVEPVKHAG